MEPTRSKGKPAGEVIIPALLCGAAGTVLSAILYLIGRYKGLDQMLKDKYVAEPYHMQGDYTLHDGWNLILLVLMCFGISFAVLDIDKAWRRVVLFLLALVVIMLCSPVMMMWDIFWSPVMVLGGLLWSWLCAFIYSVQHTMPCERFVPVRRMEAVRPTQQVTQVQQPNIVKKETPHASVLVNPPKD